MLSSPPATAAGTPSQRTRLAAIATACSPEEQNRFTVIADVLAGSPARSAAWRAMLPPVAPSGLAQPMTASSMSPGSSPARSTACLMTWPPISAPWVRLKAPRMARPIGVRAVDTMTASTMVLVPSFQFRDQLPLGELADRRMRQVRPDLERGRQFVTAELVGQEGPQRIERERRRAFPQRDIRFRSLSAIGVGHRDHGGLAHVRVLVDRVLDDARIDVEAAGDEHVLLAVNDGEAPVLGHEPDVAGQEPAVDEGARVLLRPVPVAGRDVRAADADFADLARVQHAPGVIERDHVHLDPRHRDPDFPGLLVAAGQQVRAGRGGFRHAPAAA